MAAFEKRKNNILQDLHSSQPDPSPKGHPDDEILELLQLLNSHHDYVTTSSCSGRAVVFLDADKGGHDEDARGRWLMTRHTRFEEDVILATKEVLHQTLFGDMEVGEDWEPAQRPLRVVTLKFEPLIIHVLCRSLSAALRLLRVATTSGYRESGISISALNTVSEKVLLAIRTTAIRADVPLASYEGNNKTIRPFGLSDGYIVNLLRILNEKFDENALRRGKLFTSIREMLSGQQPAPVEQTPADRRFRRRDEALEQGLGT